MSYIINIYRVGFPTLDPNVKYDIFDLQGEDTVIYRADDSKQVREFEEFFSMPVTTIIPTYDFSDLKEKFAFDCTPWVATENRARVVLTDGTKRLTAVRSKLQPYTILNSVEMYVARCEKKFALRNDGLYSELWMSFLDARGYGIVEGAMYRLSDEVLDLICAFHPEANFLHDFYGEDEHCLYIQFSDEQ